MSDILLAALTGFGTGLGLIVAIGAQNAFVLRLGISGPTRAVVAAVSICAASDLVLIAAGVLGIGVVVEQFPIALVVLRFAGAAFLIGYGVMAARRALRPAALDVGTDSAPQAPASVDDPRAALTAARPATVRRAALTVLAFTWLNPHVYIDTVLFAGSIANQQGPDLRWWWAAGAMAASIAWFVALGFGARLLRPVFARRSAWRILDSCIAVGMIALGLRLAVFG